MLLLCLWLACCPYCLLAHSTINTKLYPLSSGFLMRSLQSFLCLYVECILFLLAGFRFFSLSLGFSNLIRISLSMVLFMFSFACGSLNLLDMWVCSLRQIWEISGCYFFSDLFQSPFSSPSGDRIQAQRIITFILWLVLCLAHGSFFMHVFRSVLSQRQLSNSIEHVSGMLHETRKVSWIHL